MNQMVNQKLFDNEVFFDRLSKGYDNTIFQFWMRKFYKPLLDQIPNEAKVLDVSCGTGEFLRELNKRTKAELYGLDFSSKMVNIAKNKLGQRAKVTKGDVHELPFAENTFDFVVSTEAFHHYYDQSKALKEMRRVAKNNAKIIVVDINFFSKLIHRLFQKYEPGCVKVNNRKEMKQLFEKTNLAIKKQKRSFIFSILTEGVKK